MAGGNFSPGKVSSIGDDEFGGGWSGKRGAVREREKDSATEPTGYQDVEADLAAMDSRGRQGGRGGGSGRGGRPPPGSSEWAQRQRAESRPEWGGGRDGGGGGGARDSGGRGGRGPPFSRGRGRGGRSRGRGRGRY